MQFKLPKRLPPWLIIVASFFAVAAVSITFALVDDNGDGRPDRVDITAKIVKVQPADPGPPITAPAKQVDAAVAELERRNEGALDHEHGKGKPLTKAQIAANEKVADANGIDGIAPILRFGASFNQRGCRTIPQGTNFSARQAGVRPTLIGAAHIWVMAERPGWGDVLAVRDFLARIGTGASSHYIIDGEGHCAYTVPETAKAWTAGNMNGQTACNIEMGGVPDDNGWMRPAGMAKAALVMRDCAKRWDIPIQVGNTRGCTVVTPGVVDHNELECGNDHWDICTYAEKQRTSGSDNCPAVYRIVEAMRKIDRPTSRLTKRERSLVRERCERRRQVVTAAKGSTARRSALGASRIARRQVRDQMRTLTKAKRSSGRPWSYRHRGARRHELARAWTGKGCATR